MTSFVDSWFSSFLSLSFGEGHFFLSTEVTSFARGRLLIGRVVGGMVGEIAGGYTLVGGIVGGVIGGCLFWRDTFCRNKKWLNDRYNLAVYKKGRSSVYFADLRKHPLFKKCDLALNTYYWKFMTLDGYLYYTTVGQEDELVTMHNIARTLKLDERMIDEFFECILFSYVTSENERMMNEMVIDGYFGYIDYMEKCIVVETADFYSTLSKKGGELKINPANAPNLTLGYLNEKWIFGAYNGSNVKEIGYMLRQYKKSFSTDRVFVFASGLGASGQFDFKIYTLDAKGKVVNHTEDIKIGPLFPISAARLSKTYSTQFANFSEEVHYWLRCKRGNKIIERA